MIAAPDHGQLAEMEAAGEYNGLVGGDELALDLKCDVIVVALVDEVFKVKGEARAATRSGDDGRMRARSEQ